MAQPPDFVGESVARPHFARLRWPRSALIVVVVIASIAGWMWIDRPRVKVLHEQLTVRGETREYRLVLPLDLRAREALPVVLAFHGAGDSPEQMANYTGLDRLAEEQRCCLVYPLGRFQSWPPSMAPDNPEPVARELAFCDALVDELSSRFSIDSDRVYAVGMSQGGAFVNLLVAKWNSRLAAAASHSGWLPKPLPEDGWEVTHSTPVLFITGSEDRQVSPTLVREAYDACQKQGHPVEFVEIPGLGHQWATGHNVNSRIWQFLNRHRRETKQDSSCTKDP